MHNHTRITNQGYHIDYWTMNFGELYARKHLNESFEDVSETIVFTLWHKTLP